MGGGGLALSVLGGIRPLGAPDTLGVVVTEAPGVATELAFAAAVPVGRRDDSAGLNDCHWLRSGRGYLSGWTGSSKGRLAF